MSGMQNVFFNFRNQILFLWGFFLNSNKVSIYSQYVNTLQAFNVYYLAIYELKGLGKNQFVGKDIPKIVLILWWSQIG